MPLFEELGPDDFEWIARATHVRSFAAGESVFEIGEPGRSRYIVTAGNVQVPHPHESASYQLARLGPGEFLREMAQPPAARGHFAARSKGGRARKEPRCISMRSGP